MKKKIKLFDPWIDDKEKLAIKNVLTSKFWASGQGTGKVLEFETKFRKFIGSDSCVCVSNGTAALHLALSLIDIKNKEVILPSLSFVSTAHAVIYNGGIPVFVDIEPNDLCIDYELIKKNISDRTKIILPVHFGGMPCNLMEIEKIGKTNRLQVIEDAAHAAGASFKGKKIGRHGTAVCFSFHPVKNLAMSTGGAITLNGKNNSKFSKILKTRRWCGISERNGPYYDVTDLGWNYYMNEFSAAMGIEQLKKLSQSNKKRKEIARRYHKEINLEEKMSYNRDCSYHLYWIQVKNRNNFMKKMSENNIETGIHYLPIHKMKFYNNKTKLPITERVGKNIVTLPIHPNLADSDIDKIVQMTNKFSKTT